MQWHFIDIRLPPNDFCVCVIPNQSRDFLSLGPSEDNGSREFSLTLIAWTKQAESFFYKSPARAADLR